MLPRFVCCFFLALLGTAGADPVVIDPAVDAPDLGIRAVFHDDVFLDIYSRDAKGAPLILSLDLRDGKPLLSALTDHPENSKFQAPPILAAVDPVLYLTVGLRAGEAARPLGRSIWQTFFDSPVKRPHQTHRSAFAFEKGTATRAGRCVTAALSGLTAGPFKGEWRFSLFAGSSLVKVEAVVSTTEDEHAIYYDLGFIGEKSGLKTFAWQEQDGAALQRAAFSADGLPDRAIASRHRAIIGEGSGHSLAVFPSPHQFFFPRDWTDNLSYVWMGRNHAGLTPEFGFGIRQAAQGGGNFSPWYNAPPNTEQHLGVWLLPTKGNADAALAETLRYTHGDSFQKLPGFVTWTSHVHMAVAEEAAKHHFEGEPDFVGMFRDLGVNAVHLADFHGDGHQTDPGPLRLPEMAALFKECQRLSRPDFLLMPGEEVMDHFFMIPRHGLAGHWITYFPKPVFWTQARGEGQPFTEEAAPYGKVYHVGNSADMLNLLREEHGLSWTTHPRIKASQWTPDAFRHEDYFHSDTWLGAGWKAMPADLSRERLGERSLDLLDDMCNWGERKYLPAEIDVFKLKRAHELYAHMNINYLELDHLPNYGEGWQPILDTLRAGKFFVTTGEVLIPKFTVGGRRSGETLRGAAKTEVRADIEWTFPLRFAEVVSGDGKQVYRDRVELTDTESFGKRTLTIPVDLTGRKWVRFAVWDAAVDGAFTQPVWLE